MSKAGRNDPCPCGSGKKYKQCCLPRAALPNAAPPPVGQWLQQAMALHQSGRLAEAQALYSQILQAQPQHAEALHLSGLVAQSEGRLEQALELISAALRRQPGNVAYLSNLGNLRQSLGQYAEAVHCYQQALAQRPDLAELHNNLGNALQAQAQYLPALTSYQRAQALNRSYPAAWLNQGLVLRRLDRLEEAIAAFRQVLRLQPTDATAHEQLAECLLDLGQVDAAEAALLAALQVNPQSAAALNNLGNLRLLQDRLDDAAQHYAAALAMHPDFAVAHHNYAQVQMRRQNWLPALQHLAAAVSAQPCAEFKISLGQCLRRLHTLPQSADWAEVLAEALRRAWARPVELAGPALALLRQQPALAAAWSSPSAAVGPAALAPLVDQPLLLAVLEHAPIPDLAVEDWLTGVRRALLAQGLQPEPPPATVLRFYRALATQCFINEYVYAVGADEAEQVQQLRATLSEALQQGRATGPLPWLALACYQSLGELEQAAQLLQQPWAAELAELLQMTVHEPMQEAALAASTTVLTPIAAGVSQQVQQQYEQHPYPRWISTVPAGSRVTLQQHLRQLFPQCAPTAPRDTLAVLVAGCGTGQQAIETAQYFRGAQVLAVDLSLASLAYARRKSAELGLDNIEYAQADLLLLGGLDRQFDLIESTGVLHHLADPLQGWQVLTSLLRPGGYMRLALYSATARQAVVAARAFIAEHGCAADNAAIRACRQALRQRPDLIPVATFTDFYSTSACRDLLFHVQEHRYTLPLLQQHLDQLGLQLLGFDVASEVAAEYRRRHPDDVSMTHLPYWHAFEQAHPATFAGMYQFWVQKSAT